MPQADPEQSRMFFGNLSEQAQKVGISYSEMVSDVSPDFWGPMWKAETGGINFNLFKNLRDFAWSSYKRVIEQTKVKIPFDYRPLQEYMVFGVSEREHHMFNRMGLSVPVEAQAAFFSAMMPNF
jgi:hypothetical protein